jgi:hypothetical protein
MWSGTGPLASVKRSCGLASIGWTHAELILSGIAELSRRAELPSADIDKRRMAIAHLAQVA